MHVTLYFISLNWTLSEINVRLTASGYRKKRHYSLSIVIGYDMADSNGGKNVREN